MNKSIALKDGSFINLNNEDGQFVIDKDFSQYGETIKLLTMTMGDDFEFEAYPFKDDDNNNLNFSISTSDPLYDYIITILGEDESLKINDDLTEEEDQKYMEIKKRARDILFNFVNNLENVSSANKFDITIINIKEDERSKLDAETKEKIFKFFKAVRDEMLLGK